MLFAGIVNFTPMSARLPTEYLVCHFLRSRGRHASHHRDYSRHDKYGTSYWNCCDRAGDLAFNLLCLLAANRIVKALGPSTLQIIAKIAGLLLTALAIQLMILGFTDLGLIERVMEQH